MNIIVIQLNLNKYIKLEHYIKVIVGTRLIVKDPYFYISVCIGQDNCYRKIDNY
jgi:hypothetical protein